MSVWKGRIACWLCRVVSHLCGGQVWGGDDLGEGSAAHEVRVEEGADLLRVRATQVEGEREKREREVSMSARLRALDALEPLIFHAHSTVRYLGGGG